MSDSQRLSVVIPAFNASRTIVSAIQSAQFAGASQILVIDDGSTDDTGARAASTTATVIRQENRGAAYARAYGLAQVSGDFLIYLDADDQLSTNGVRAALRLLEDNPVLVAAVGGYTVLGSDGLADEHSILPWQEGVSASSLLMRGHSPAPPASIVWRITPGLIDDSGPAPLRPRWAEDYEQLIRAALRGPIGTIACTVSTYDARGGKSATNPGASLLSAERIRRYYSEASGIRIRIRRPSEIAALALLRRSYSASTPAARIAFRIGAGVRSPRLLFGLLSDRRSRRAAGSRTLHKLDHRS